MIAAKKTVVLPKIRAHVGADDTRASLSFDTITNQHFTNTVSTPSASL
jgi:hypothetical protein